MLCEILLGFVYLLFSYFKNQPIVLMQADEFKEMATTPSLVEALQVVDPKLWASLKQIMVVISQANGSNNRRVDVLSMSDTFYEASLRSISSSITITHLRIMGKGFKRAILILVSIDKISKAMFHNKKIIH